MQFILYVYLGTTPKESVEIKERKTSMSSIDEVDSTSREISQEKRSRLESSDYNAKTMEDLEYLQEDLHKELAEINEKSLQKRKHKKTSSSSHRDKRHKEKTTSRHKEREKGKSGRNDERDQQRERGKDREREKDKQRSSDSRGGDVRREVDLS